jgi:hypothetical protein
MMEFIHKQWYFCGIICYYQSSTEEITPGPSHNQKQLLANTQGDSTVRTDSTAVDDVNKSIQENDESDLTELNIG